MKFVGVNFGLFIQGFTFERPSLKRNSFEIRVRLGKKHHYLKTAFQQICISFIGIPNLSLNIYILNFFDLEPEIVFKLFVSTA